MTENDGLRRYVEAATALTQITRSRAEELVRELIKAGELERHRAQEWVEDLVKTSRERSEALVDAVRGEVRHQLKDLGFTNVDDLAKKVADMWDPAKDEAAGEQCKSYGAPAIMRVPGRLHITWQDPNTLQVETDAGRQIRLFHFGAWTPPSDAPATWQGDSVANWETPRPVGGGGGVGPSQAEQGRGAAPNDKDVAKHGDLKVVTTHIRPGYLRKNGIPYGASAAMTEYWDLNKETNGQPWIVITALVNDPVYLQAEWVTALHFKKEPDGSKWDPSPCSSRW